MRKTLLALMTIFCTQAFAAENFRSPAIVKKKIVMKKIVKVQQIKQTRSLAGFSVK